MKWYFMLWLAMSQSLGGPFDSREDCVRDLEQTLSAARAEFGYPDPGGICFEGAARHKADLRK